MGDVFDQVASERAQQRPPLSTLVRQSDQGNDVFEQVARERGVSQSAPPTGPRGEVGNIRPPQPEMSKMFGTESIAALGRSPLRPTPQDTQFYQEHPIAAAGGGVAGIAVPASLPLVRPVASAGMRLMKAHPILSTLALSGAQELPGVGKYLRKIPSWLPMLAGGGKEAPLAAEEGAATAESQTLKDQVRNFSYPPEYSPSIPQIPAARQAAEEIETRNLQEQVRDAAAREEATLQSRARQEYRTRNDPSTPKSTLIEQVRAQTPANIPTAESKAASQAAFEKRYPNDRFTTMDPIAQRAWQESAFGEEPLEDVGTKVRSTKKGVPRTGGKRLIEQMGGKDVEDLTPEWTKALEDIQRRKGQAPAQ